MAASGSTASTQSTEGASATPSAAASASPSAAASPSTADQDEVTCEAFADVQTILLNSHVAFTQDRMTAAEENGWTSLASRVLNTIPAADEGPVAEALAAAKAAVPPTEGVEGADFTSEEARDAVNDVYTACQNAGIEVAMDGFVGG